jgi:hypothetical protein
MNIMEIRCDQFSTRGSHLKPLRHRTMAVLPQCRKNTAGDCYESNRQKTQSSNTPAYLKVKPVFLTTWMKTRRIKADTHYRVGDWEVVRVEEYPTSIPNNTFEAIVVCYCKYSPVQTRLIPMPKATVSVDSFDSEEKYQQYLEQTKQATALV